MRAGQGDTLQCFEVKEDFCNLESGTYLDQNTAHCVTSGDIIVTWESGATNTFSMTAGEDLCFMCKSIQVDSGKFHLNRL